MIIGFGCLNVKNHDVSGLNPSRDKNRLFLICPDLPGGQSYLAKTEKEAFFAQLAHSAGLTCIISYLARLTNSRTPYRSIFNTFFHLRNLKDKNENGTVSFYVMYVVLCVC